MRTYGVRPAAVIHQHLATADPQQELQLVLMGVPRTAHRADLKAQVGRITIPATAHDGKTRCRQILTEGWRCALPLLGDPGQDGVFWEKRLTPDADLLHIQPTAAIIEPGNASIRGHHQNGPGVGLGDFVGEALGKLFRASAGLGPFQGADDVIAVPVSIAWCQLRPRPIRKYFASEFGLEIGQGGFPPRLGRGEFGEQQTH